MTYIDIFDGFFGVLIEIKLLERYWGFEGKFFIYSRYLKNSCWLIKFCLMGLYLVNGLKVREIDGFRVGVDFRIYFDLVILVECLFFERTNYENIL